MPTASLPSPALDIGGDGHAPVRCLQCETALAGPFCHACGQHESVAERLAFRSLWHDFRVRRLSLDRGLPRTVVDVLLRPGHVARTFVDGKRQTYTHPVTLLFVVYAVYAVIFKLVEDGYGAMMEAQMKAQLAGSLPATGEPDAAMEMAMTVMMEAVRFLFTYGAYFTLLIVLPFAALLRWLLADRGRTMAESAVFGAYVEAAVVIPSALVLTPLSVALQSTWVGSLSLILYLVYAAWGSRQFFDRRPGTMGLAALSIVVALAVYFAVIMVLALGVGLFVGFQQAHAGG